MTPSRPQNIIGHISHFFALNRPLSLLVIVSVLIFGLVSFLLLPKQYNPEIVRPAFMISLTYQGATTEAAVDRVVYELVQKIKTVEGVDDILTEVTDGAEVATTVIFTVGHDTTKAKVDLLAQLEQHSYLAQGFIAEPTVMEINPETIPVLHLVFEAPALSIGTLRAAVVDLSHALSDTPDVSEITVAGGYPPGLMIEVDPLLLTAAGVAMGDVTAAVAGSQLRQVAPGVRQAPYQLEVVFDGQAKTPEDIGLLHVADGVLLRDVAMVYEGVNGSRSYVLHQGAEGLAEVVTLSVAKVEGASAPVVTAAALTSLDRVLATPSYQGITYTVVANDGATASAEINGLMGNLITSILIVAAVLLLFLSARVALVVLIAIPTTLLIVFGLGLLFDQTINRITLFALILSLGLLVDSAIVVVENIYAHLREWKEVPAGRQREEAVAGAVHEIGAGLVLSTLTSVIVFLPMLYITGMMGPYMGPIAFFVPVALLVSMLVAVVIVPFVAAHLIDPAERPSRVTRTVAGLMTQLTLRYEQLLRYIFAKRQRQAWLLKGMLALFLVTLILPATGLVHFQMLPKADRDQFYVYLDAPVGTDTETVRTLATDVGTVLLEHAEVVSVQHFVATAPMLDFNGMFKGAQGRTSAAEATLRVNLTPATERGISSGAVVAELRATVAALPAASEVQVRFMEEPPGPPVQATLVAKFMHADEAVRSDAAIDFQTLLRDVSGVVDVDTSFETSTGRVVYTYDQVVGQQLGVSAAAVAEVLAALGEPQRIGEYLASTAAEYVPVSIGITASARTSPADISGLSVMSAGGEVVPLTALVTVTTEARPSAVQLEGATPLTYVTAEVADRSIVYVTIELIRKLVAGELPGYTVTDWSLFAVTLATEQGEELVLAWGGEWEMTLENFRDLGIAMLVALALVYSILVAQYRRFDVPGFILVTIPLGLIGILWGFFVLDVVFGIYLTATALIGFIALIGIVVNNAIIYLEYVEQSEAAGLSRTEALLAAGTARLRPILLTSLTTVLGSLTIASDPVWSGLAWAIVFGLSLSTVLTLVVYPALLVYFGRKKEVVV